MKLVPMRFSKHTWHHNPKSLKVSCDKSIAVLNVPYSDDVIQQFGDNPIRISGIGELYGDDCIMQYNALYDLYKNHNNGVLCIPGLRPVYACLTSLDMTVDNTPSVVTYSFEFLSTKHPYQLPQSPCFVTPKNGESLWDISYTNDVPIETLVQLNPEVFDIFDIDGIERIRIC